MEVPLMDLKAQYAGLRAELLEAVDDALTGMQLNLGPNVQAFESEWAHYCGVDHAIGVSNGTEALSLVLRALDIGPGDEVITTAWTFFATIEAIVHVGAAPVVVDIEPRTYCMDPECLKDAVTQRTRGLIVVDVFGHPADFEAIGQVAAQGNIAIVEDAAQAHGALCRGARVGSLGTAGTFSFYPTKNLGGYGEGGIVTTNCDHVADNLRLLRNHGHASKYEHALIGYNARLDEIQAAMLRVKLAHLDDWNARRRRCAAAYDERLAGLPIETPYEAEWAEHVYHLYTICTEARDRLSEAFDEAGIGHSMHYRAPGHQQPACQPFGLPDVRLPVTEQLAKEVIQLPMHPLLKEEEIDYVCDVVRKTLG